MLQSTSIWYSKTICTKPLVRLPLWAHILYLDDAGVILEHIKAAGTPNNSSLAIWERDKIGMACLSIEISQILALKRVGTKIL